MPHLLPSDPQRCRLEVLFRLLRHDVVAPLAAALQQFRSLGGLGWLQQRDRRMQQQVWSGAGAVGPYSAGVCSAVAVAPCAA